MTLPSVTLFPQALLPLFIFEPRYRKMLRDTLQGSRIFAVAMQKPEALREAPTEIAGVGLVRACVTHPDGTSHLVLQGLARVELGAPIQQKPYRIHPIKPLETKGSDTIIVEALTAKVLDLVAERFEHSPQGGAVPQVLNELYPVTGESNALAPDKVTLDQMMKYFSKLENPSQLADLVTCTLLTAPNQRQTILETVNLEERLKYLIHFLMAGSGDGGKTEKT